MARNCGCPAWARGWWSRLVQLTLVAVSVAAGWFSDGWSGVATAAVAWAVVGFVVVAANWSLTRRRVWATNGDPAFRTHAEIEPMQDDAMAAAARRREAQIDADTHRLILGGSRIPASVLDRQPTTADQERVGRFYCSHCDATNEVNEAIPADHPMPSDPVRAAMRGPIRSTPTPSLVQRADEFRPRTLEGSTRALVATYGERRLCIQPNPLTGARGPRFHLTIDGGMVEANDDVEVLKLVALRLLSVGGSMAHGLDWRERL